MRFTPHPSWRRAWPSASSRGRRVVPDRAAAAAAGDRRTGRAVSRGARAVARNGHPHGDRSERAEGGSHSPALVRKLVESAVERAGTIARGSGLERAPLKRYARGAVALAFVSMLAFVFGPAYLRHALSALLVISRSVEAAAPYRIEVTPGHATVARGADLPITAKLIGFQADEASVMTRRTPTAAFERLPLVRGSRRCLSGHAVRRAAAARVLRRGRRRAVGGVQAEGRRHAVRPAARADLRVPGLYRAAAAEDRGRRRHRRAARHEVHVRAVPTMAAAGGAIVVDETPACDAPSTATAR